MKRKMKIAMLGLIAGLFFLIIYLKQPLGTKIDVSKYKVPEYTGISEKIKIDSLSLSIIETGFGEAPEAMMFKGGSLFKIRKISHISVLVKHPKGTFVFDTGLGDSIEAQFKRNVSFLGQMFMKFSKKESLKEAFSRNNFDTDLIDFILLSHLHFDHAGGILDFPDLVVKTTKEEYEHAISEEASSYGFIKEQYNSETIRWEFLDFKTEPYLGFSMSYDVFSDRSVILVKLPGHTTGSIGMFVNLPSGKKYFFTGDLTAVKEGFELPAEKHPLFRSMVDYDNDETKNVIVQIHYLMKKHPEIKVVPAHDFEAQKEIARFPEFER